MPRFVILRHDMPPGSARPSHFDLMFEQGQALRTWACEALPAIGRATLAEQLADHRLAYLDLEGEVSGGRGHVTRVAAGQYELLVETEGLVRVRLDSEALSGELTLARETQPPYRWRVSLSGVASPC